MYKITKNGYPVSYVLGNIHVVNFSKNNPMIIEIAKQCSIYISEADMVNIMDDENIIDKIIPKTLTESDWREKFGYLMERLEKIAPLKRFICLDEKSLKLMISMFILNNTFEQNYTPMEEYLEKLTHWKKKIFLESIDEQISALINSLEDTLCKNTLEILVDNFGEIVGFCKKDYEFLIDTPDFVACSDLYYIGGRNVKWIDTIIKNFKINSCFLTVGLGHLFGDSKSITSLLKNEGFTIDYIGELMISKEPHYGEFPIGHITESHNENEIT